MPVDKPPLDRRDEPPSYVAAMIRNHVELVTQLSEASLRNPRIGGKFLARWLDRRHGLIAGEDEDKHQGIDEVTSLVFDTVSEILPERLAFVVGDRRDWRIGGSWHEHEEF